MRENPYKRLPPIERKPDGSLYRMTPAQRKQANALIRRECCCYEDGNCMLLDDGDTHTCPQTASFSVCGGVFVRNAQRRHVAGVAYIFRGVFRAAAGWDIYVVLTGLGGVVRHGEHGASYGDKLNVRVKRLRSACALQR